MATLLLTALGTAVGGPIGGAIGALVGQRVDQALFAPGGRVGGRLADRSVPFGPDPRHDPLEFLAPDPLELCIGFGKAGHEVLDGCFVRSACQV